MKHPEGMVEGALIERVNRFAVNVNIADKTEYAAMANPGRMKELMIPGTRCLLLPSNNPERKTRFTLLFVHHNGGWVSLHSHLANDLFAETVENRIIPELSDYRVLRREVTVGRSRLDFLLCAKSLGEDVVEVRPGRDFCYVEVKSCTLVEQGTARFPDAPTIRGARHMRELADLATLGYRCAVVFIMQRGDAKRFLPHREMDPDFAEALVNARNTGVEAYAVSCTVDDHQIRPVGTIPVFLDRPAS